MKTFTKKILTVTLSSIGMLTLQAATAYSADENTPFDGPYIGVGAAINKSNSGASITPSATTTLESKSKLSEGIYVGYGKQMDQVYLGIEGGFYFNGNVTPTATFGATSAGLKSKNTLDLSARAGFVAGKALIYGVTGYTSTNYETTDLVANAQKRLNGIRYGGGIEYAITPNASFRAEYTHANYKEWDVASGTNNITFDPSEHRFVIGSVFRF
jgi:outer membrane immunogenic protein